MNSYAIRSFSLLISLWVLSGYFGILAGQTNLIRIHDVQGSAATSSLVGQIIALDTSVVTYATATKAYVQDPTGDGDPTTSEGLLLLDGNTLQLSPGDRVLVSGRVGEVDGHTALINSVTINKLSAGAPLSPTPFTTPPDPAAGLSPHERFEGMLVAFDLTAATGTNGFGSFSAYATTLERPFREPGILAPGLSGLPVYDGNPELLSYDPDGLGQNEFLLYRAGDRVQGRGILEQFSFGYELSPLAPIDYDPAPDFAPLPLGSATELTVGCLNTLFLLEDEDNYNLRLAKVVNYIAEQLRFPDVIALQEIGGQNEVEDLLFRLRQRDPVRGDYAGLSTPSSGFLELGYLVNRRISNPTLTTLGNDEFFSQGGFLHNRFPLLLTFDVPGGAGTKLRILNLHVRSLNGIEDDPAVRLRRQEQAESIAVMVEELRDENLLVVGDYNAFEFTDGYADVFNQISGLPSQGALLPVENIVSPPLRSAAELLPENERYSFLFRGSAQQLDHCLYNELDGLTLNDFRFARGNADASVFLASNSSSPLRASDHDGFVAYLGVDALTNVGATTVAADLLSYPNPIRAGQGINYHDLPQHTTLSIRNTLGQIIVTRSELAGSGRILMPDRLPGGTYLLELRRNERPLLTEILLLR